MAAAREALPPLAGEDHVCPECARSYDQITVEQAVAFIQTVPAVVRQAVAGVPVRELRQRPDPRTWSVTEYVCHLRDVFATYTIRLYRARTEDGPAVEPMFNELRATRFRYNDRQLAGVLDELEANVAGFCEQVSRVRPGEWERIVFRLPDEPRTTRWLVRQAMHEGQHHLGDIRSDRAGREPPSPA